MAARSVISHGLACIVMALFAYAGVLKWLDPTEFHQAILNYRIVGYQLAWIAAFLVPSLELISAAALVFPRWRKAAAWLLLCLIMVFTLAIIAAWARGLDIECGCFGELSEGISYPWRILRNLAISAVLIVLLRSNTNEAPANIFNGSEFDDSDNEQ